MSNALRDLLIDGYWRLKGRPIPPHGAVKRRIIASYARRFGTRVLIETGTYRGDMIWAQRDHFDKLYSIELADQFFRDAVERFKAFPHIKIVHGDSGVMLGPVLKEVDQPALFWLDGHYSAGETARGELDCPIVKEFDHVFAHAVRDHVILIDDARHFIGSDGYPTIEQTRRMILARRPDWHFEVADDLIRAHPKRR